MRVAWPKTLENLPNVRDLRPIVAGLSVRPVFELISQRDVGRPWQAGAGLLLGVAALLAPKAGLARASATIKGKLLRRFIDSFLRSARKCRRMDNNVLAVFRKE